MPTVLRPGALRVVIYPNDYRPAHLRVIGQGYEAVFELNGQSGTVALRESYGFSRRELSTIARRLLTNRELLPREWEQTRVSSGPGQTLLY